MKVYYGQETKLALNNFLIGSEITPHELIYAYAIVKKAAAVVNCEFNLLDEAKKELICEVCDEIMAGKLDDQFPLKVWQTGAGTQVNMNLNEVIANRALHLSKEIVIHPYDDANMSQSSNDTFPTAMNIATLFLIHKKLFKNLNTLVEGIDRKGEEFKDIIKVGRTHLMDATPITLGQELSAFSAQMKKGIEDLKHGTSGLLEIPIGGTAVGTGVNSPLHFGRRVAEEIREITGFEFVSSPNKFESISATNRILMVSSALRQIAVIYLKLANDVSLLSSGPRCGIGEIILPANEKGSSIMPGKVNPTQCEAMKMVATQVIGNDTTILLATLQGNLQLNVCRPVIIYNLLQSIHLLADVSLSFYDKCLAGIQPNRVKIEQNLRDSLMLATVLNRRIGYDRASEIVRTAQEKNISLKEATRVLGFLSEKDFDEVVDPRKMIEPDQ